MDKEAGNILSFCDLRDIPRSGCNSIVSGVPMKLKRRLFPQNESIVLDYYSFLPEASKDFYVDVLLFTFYLMISNLSFEAI